MKRFLKILILTFFALGLLLGVTIYWMLQPVDRPSGLVSLVVTPGSSTRQIAEKLENAKAIRSAEVFVFAARLKGVSGQLRAGQYDFSQDMNLLAVLDKIVRGEVSAVWVTIPEGYTGRQIAELFANRKLVDYDALLNEIYHHQRSDGGLNSLEGYLFPDTYLVPLKSDPRTIIRLMIGNFEKQVTQKYSDRIRSSGWSLPQIVTIASMIEREAKVPQDRELIASVIYNRLRIGMPLQIDATVQYALGQHRSRLFYRDLRVNSPYNTYRKKGLPPGPIANPGIKCIEAALKPAVTDYLYYVAKPDGSHVFSRTAAEHGAAIRRIRSRE